MNYLPIRTINQMGVNTLLGKKVLRKESSMCDLLNKNGGKERGEILHSENSQHKGMAPGINWYAEY